MSVNKNINRTEFIPSNYKNKYIAAIIWEVLWLIS